MDELDKIYNELIEKGYFTEEELNLITNINGYSIETLNDCIYARYGLRTYKDLIDEKEQ